MSVHALTIRGQQTPDGGGQVCTTCLCGYERLLYLTTGCSADDLRMALNTQLDRAEDWHAEQATRMGLSELTSWGWFDAEASA